MPDSRIQSFQAESEKVLAHLKLEFSKLQTGRANPAMVEHVMVDAYGQKQELRAVAGITIQDGRTIVVQPWDRSILQSVEKALQTANLGASPVNDGVVIRISLSSMTEERRKQLQKFVHQLAEDARVSIRKHRQGTHDTIKTEKDEDIRETMLQELQKSVDEQNGKIAEMAKRKEEEVMKI